MNYKKIFENWQFALGAIASAIMVVAVLLSVYLVVISINAAGNDIYMNSISVTGKGEVTVIPNIATFDFTVTETSEDVKSAQTMASEKINKALKYLKDNGVEEKDLKTAGYSVYPKTQWIQDSCKNGYCPQGHQEIIGYEISQTVTVKIRDTSKAGELLSGIGAISISNVGGLNFTTDDPDSLKEEAKMKAIENAKAKAEELAKSLDIKLGKIISFSEDQGYYPMYDDGMGNAYGKGMMMSAESSVTPDVPSGEQVVTYTIYIGYEIK